MQAAIRLSSPVQVQAAIATQAAILDAGAGLHG